MTELAELVLGIRQHIRDASGCEPYGSDVPPTDSEIVGVEQQLGFELPDELREIYSVCDGSALGAASLVPVGDLLDRQESAGLTIHLLTVEQEPGLTPSGESGVTPKGPVAFFMYDQPNHFAMVRSGPDKGRIHSLNTWAIDAIEMTGQHLDSWDHVAWSMSDYLKCVLELIDTEYFLVRLLGDGLPALRPAHRATEPYEEWITDSWPAASAILNKWGCGVGVANIVDQDLDHLRQELTWHERS